MKTKYLNNPDYSYDKVNRASVACGPLVKWATAQLTYADMLNKVEPLRNELKNLEKEAEKKWEAFEQRVKDDSLRNNEIRKIIQNLDEHQQWSALHYAVANNNIYVVDILIGNTFLFINQKYECGMCLHRRTNIFNKNHCPKKLTRLAWLIIDF